MAQEAAPGAQPAAGPDAGDDGVAAPAPLPAATPSPGEALRRPDSALTLFLVFSRLALQGFGGVLPVAQHELVERERWLDRAQFTELLSISQVLPGPNVVNLSLLVGDRFLGTRGAIAALAGMLLLPAVVVITLAAVYAHYAGFARVAGALRGMGAVAAGLVTATALKLWPSLRGNPLGRSMCVTVALLTFVAVAVMRWPLAWVLLALAPLAVGLALWRLGDRS